MFRNILVAIDGSIHAERALAEAADLAEGNNAALTVMTSVPDTSSWLISMSYGQGTDLSVLAQETEREYTKLLDSAVDGLPQNISVTKILTHGRPGRHILEQLQTGKHDLVVMGSRGRGEVSSLLLGSVSHQVLNASPAAVLIVHAPDDAIADEVTHVSTRR
jgi:nucleotide-binding universal stress UspA family protein